MKKLLLTAGAAAVVIGGGVATASHYDQYQNKKERAQVTAVQAARNAQLKSDLVAADELIKANAQLRAECAKGEASYAKLPLVVQKITAKPVCAPSAPTQLR